MEPEGHPAGESPPAREARLPPCFLCLRKVSSEAIHPSREEMPPAANAFEATPPTEGRFATYEDAERYLAVFTDYERMAKGASYPEDLFDLRRIHGLLQRVGNPHEGLGGIHVAGTKGKGSTATFAEAILRFHGVRTGLFTSPHLLVKEERIRVDGQLLRKDEFLHWMNVLRPALVELRESPLPPTFFDIITSVAFLQFRDREVEAAIMEVGLGGRLDSTNVFVPDVCVLTRIGLDHTEKLGNEVGQIASEKAGIIKASTRVIGQPQEPAARVVVEERCREMEVPLLWVGEQVRVEGDVRGMSEAFVVRTARAEYTDLRLSVLGEHQRVNAASAIAACEAFLEARRGQLLDPGLLREALAETRLPGRIEMLGTDPLLVADGAHNPVAVSVMLETVRQALRFDELHVVFAASRDKDIRGMMEQLAPAVHRWTLTAFDFPRIEEPEALRAILEQVAPGADVDVTHDPDDALANAYARSGKHDCILCCGSFYLVGEILKRVESI